jgi:hypothetical protein
VERSAGILVDQRPDLSTRFSFVLEPAPDLEWDLTFAEEARKTGFRVRNDRVMYMLAARTSDEERLKAELQDLVRAVNEKMDP